ERRQHRDAVIARAARGVADLAHLAVQVFDRRQQAFAFLGFAADQELAVEQFDVDGDGFVGHVIHPAFSSDFRRSIIASTLARACSLRVISAARSPVSWSRPRRKLAFSSARRRMRSSAWSSARDKAASSASTVSVVMFMARIYQDVGGAFPCVGAIQMATLAAAWRSRKSRQASADSGRDSK